LHTTHSDGTYTPGQVVDLARRSGLAAIAVTDHDTLSGVAEARAAAAGSLEVIAGVEVSADFRGCELHLLGYFVLLDNGPLTCALRRLAEHRAGRFRAMIDRLGQAGVCLVEEDLARLPASESLGRRHLAELLVKARLTATVGEAFARYLADGGPAAVPKLRLPVGEAIALVRGAGGVASWAHPAYHSIGETVGELSGLGLQALEVVYPGLRRARESELRSLAAAHGLAVTGGSDCHGPGRAGRTVGACSVTDDELGALRRLAAG